MKPVEAIKKVCAHLSKEPHEAIQTLQQHLPHTAKMVKGNLVRKSYASKIESTCVFIRDGFIDRYFGDRLIFPPVFRVISLAHPNDFKFHPNWKSNEIHQAYWDIYPEIDHGKSQAMGGSHEASNWFTTSVIHNFQKGSKTLAEMRWQLHPEGSVKHWDGMLSWFLDYIKAYPHVLELSSIKQWHSAAVSKQVQEAIKRALESP